MVSRLLGIAVAAVVPGRAVADPAAPASLPAPFAMDFVHGPGGDPAVLRNLGVASVPWLDGRLAVPAASSPAAAPAAVHSPSAPRLGGSFPAGIPVAVPAPSLEPPAATGAASLSPVVVIPPTSMAGLVQRLEGTPATSAPLDAAGVPVPSAGCIGRGLETILSPGCLRRLSPVPPVVAGVASGIPLPAMPAGYPPASPAGVPSAGASGPDPAWPQQAPLVGIGCTVTGPAGSRTFRAADEVACIRGAIAMMPPAGTVSILLLDQFGNTARARCSVLVPGGRATCSADS